MEGRFRGVGVAGVLPRRWTLLLVTAAAISVLVWFVSFRDGGPAGDGAQARSRAVLEIAPADRTAPLDLTGRTLTGERLSLADLRGSVVVLNIWGSWCPPCRSEAPVLARADRDYSARGVRFVGINVRDNPAAALAFERRYDIDYPSIDDSDGRAMLAFRDTVPASAIPSTIILDVQGRVAARVIGEIPEGTLRTLLDAALDPVVT